MRLRDHPDDADDRALFPCVIEERLLALLHGAQVVLGREVPNACPLRPVTPFPDLLGPRPIVRLGLQEPMCHGTPSSFPLSTQVARRGYRRGKSTLKDVVAARAGLDRGRYPVAVRRRALAKAAAGATSP